MLKNAAAGGSAVIVALAIATPAFAETRTSMVVAGDGSVESNPYAVSTGSSATASVGAQVDPKIAIVTATSTLALHGTARVQQYTSRYGTEVSGGAAADYVQHLSDHTTLNAAVGYHTSLSGVRDQLSLRIDPTDTTTPPDLVLIDPSLIGQRLRNQSLNASAGLSFMTSARDTLSLSSGYNQSWVKGTAGNDFRFITGQANFSHVLSAHSSVNASVSYGSSHYFNTASGDSTTISPQVGISTVLGARMMLLLQGGATFVRINQGNGTKRNVTAFSGQVNLCRHGEYDDFCLAASRAAQPTLFGGMRNLTRLSFDYSRKLSERNRLSLQADYSRGDGSYLPSSTSLASLVGGSASFSRQFNRRFSGFVTAGAQKAYDTNTQRPVNAFGRIGLRYLFGDDR